jgi:F-type H+-transporting ATPase subunit delta
VYNDVETVRAYMEKNPEAADFLGSPAQSKERKNEVLKQMCDQMKVNTVSRRFLGVLVEKERADQLLAVLNDFENLYCEETGTLKAEVRSAVELTQKQETEIAKKVKALTNASNVKIRISVDESLMGGFVVQYGSDGSGFIDQSVKGSLEEISQHLFAGGTAV